MENSLPVKSKMSVPAQNQDNNKGRKWQIHNKIKLVLLMNTGVCTLIALIGWSTDISTGIPGLLTQFLYSMLIGQTICVSFLSLSYFQQRRPEFPLAATILLYPIIILFGFFAGSSVAALIVGHSHDFFTFNDMLKTSLLVTVLVSIASCWYYISREREASFKLQAAEESARAAADRLSMLQAQVEPHMLFNTLANLRSLIATDPARAEHMLDQLVQFLRATLTGSQSSTTTLADEFKILENYLNLMQIRLGERLSFELELPKFLENVQVPALILQPLVENAFKHGIEPSESGGHITVRAQSVDSMLTVEVNDTGVGFTLEDGSFSSGFGLHSVRERLKPLPSGLENPGIESPPPNCSTGTKVTIHLPLDSTASTSAAITQ